MKDLIWTLIIIWLVYRLFSLFRLSGKTDPLKNRSDRDKKFTFSGKKPKEAREAVHRSLDKEGEYVDFEEIR